MSVVVVVISASCAGYGVSSFVAKLFSLNNNFFGELHDSFPAPKYGFYNHFREDFLSALG